MSELTNKQCLQILDRAELRATELGVNACITIVDAGAHMMAFRRMDGAALGPIDVSHRKARTSVLFVCDTGDFGKAIRERHLLNMEHTNGGLVAFAGGIPIKADDVVIGAIGVSGGSSEQDKMIASYALNLD